MGPEDKKTLTIAKRTKKNLDYIYKAKSENKDVEEFTQLLNSMLSIIICIREDYFKWSSSNISWNDIESKNLQCYSSELRDLTGDLATTQSPDLKPISSFSQLITKMRHAFAHNCFALNIDETTGQITGVTVWNIRSREDNIPENYVWQAKISESNLKNLAYLVIEYLEKELQ